MGEDVELTDQVGRVVVGQLVDELGPLRGLERSQQVGGLLAVDPATIDWKQVTPRTFGYQLRQEPGPKNALGRIKFMFPNRFDIYLHDTPSKGLFTLRTRMFSSGCVRVDRAYEFAKQPILHATARTSSSDLDAPQHSETHTDH